MSHDELLTPAEVAAILKIKPQTLAKWRCEGSSPPYCEIGSRVRYSRRRLDEWLAGRERQSTSDVQSRNNRRQR